MAKKRPHVPRRLRTLFPTQVALKSFLNDLAYCIYIYIYVFICFLYTHTQRSPARGSDRRAKERERDREREREMTGNFQHGLFVQSEVATSPMSLQVPTALQQPVISNELHRQQDTTDKIGTDTSKDDGSKSKNGKQ